MHKGKVSTDFLNVRLSGANRDRSPLEEPLARGEEVNIVKAIYGEELEGENTWFQLDTGEYVWAGGVEVESDVKIETKRIIFTADDYGVVDSINLGIINAIEVGILNSVTCLTNYGPEGRKSLANIRVLEKLKERHQLEIGVHLTITSGSPILGSDRVPNLCRQKRKREKGYSDSDFVDFAKIRRHYKRLDSSEQKAFLDQLYLELKRQIEVFSKPTDGGPPIVISHLTSHHNSLLFHEDFFKVLLRLSNEFEVKINGRSFPVPLRSLKNLPQWKDTGYYNTKGKILFPKLNIAKLVRNLGRAENKKIKSVGLLHSNHFGPIPAILKKNIDKLVMKKYNLSSGMLKDFARADTDSMEFLLHLRAGNVYNSHRKYEKETKSTGYAGINPKSFDGRTAEFRSFIKRFPNLESLPMGIQLGTWEELFADLD